MKSLCFVLVLAVAVAAGAEPLPCEEILIPGGTFLMGQLDNEGDRPQHEVTIGAFHLDQFEVTNAQYLVFCEETERRLPEFWGKADYHSTPDFAAHPVVGVSWWDARAYAEWTGKRLPTEAEWEFAARGGLVGIKYVFGDSINTDLANYGPSEPQGTLPVGSYDANGYGLYDMCGNVVEWVSDAYDKQYYLSDEQVNPTGPVKGRYKVIRGGGWHTGPSCCSVHFRNALPSNWLDFAVGFRCARDADEAEDG